MRASMYLKTFIHIRAYIIILGKRLSYHIDAIIAVTHSLRIIRRAGVYQYTDLGILTPTLLVSVSGFSRVYIRGTF